MNAILKKAWVLVGIGLFSLPAFAQERYIRSDDQFWKKRVVNRIPLNEKINKALVFHSSPVYADGSAYEETNGIVVALLNGVKKNKFVAYHPDDWDRTMDYPAIRHRMRKLDSELEEDQESNWDDDTVMEDEGFSVESSWNEDEWAFEEWDDMQVEHQERNLEEPESEINYYPYEQMFHMVEDWMFDKVGSEMVQRISFFEIIWQDPMGTLPDEVLARFKWEEVKDHLEKTQWKNRFNDGEDRSMKEVMALRIFNSIMINIGDQPIASLHEAIRRKEEMIAFEHNLWSY